MRSIRRMLHTIQGHFGHREDEKPPVTLPPITITQTIKENFGSVTGAIINLPDPDAERLREARGVLLARVKSYWIEVEGAARSKQGALQAIESDHNAFVQGAGLLNLPKRFTPDAVNFSSRAADVVAHLDRNGDGDVLAPERPIYELFQEAQHALLILGVPGVGKTVTLLQLARDALRAAEADADKPIPVVFDLAAWANDPQPIAEWIAHELNSIQYGIPKEITRLWLRNNDLLLLLDGLNELDAPTRGRCVARLNQFIQEQGLCGIALCCRTEEYNLLHTKLTLHDAITVEPLSPEQVDAYFRMAGEPLSGLRAALTQDPVLHELTATPLMLHIMSIAYADVERADIPADQQVVPETRRTHLFDLYVARMFRYGGEDDKPYTDSQTTGWLAWLARQMDAHNRPVFLIEQLQPSWLPSLGWRWLYMLASRASVGLIGGLVGGIVIGMARAPLDGVAMAFQRGLAEGLVGGVLAGLVVGGVDMLWITRVRPSERLRHLSHGWQSAIKIAATTLAVIVVVSLMFALLFGPFHFNGEGPLWWAGEGILVGLVTGLSASLLFAFGPRAVRYNFQQDIQTVERVSWSRGRAWRGALLATGVGIVAGAVAGVIAQRTALVEPLVRRGLPLLAVVALMGLIGGAVFALIGTVFGGFGGTFYKVEKVSPNEGLRLSLMNAGRTALIVGVIFMVVGGLIGFFVSGGEPGYLFAYLFYGLFIGVLAALWYGGVFALQHAVLRLLLWRAGHTPPPGQYARLLDYAAQRIFLYKVGGGYKFVNRYVQEHFAAMHNPKPATGGMKRSGG